MMPRTVNKGKRRASIWITLLYVLIASGALANLVKHWLDYKIGRERDRWCQQYVEKMRQQMNLQGFKGHIEQRYHQMQDSVMLSEKDTAGLLSKKRLDMMAYLVDSLRWKSPFLLSSELEKRQQEAYRQGKIVNEAAFVDHIFIPEEQIMEMEMKDGECMVKYVLSVRTPKNARDVLPRELAGVYNNIIMNCPAYSEMSGLLNQRIDLSAIYPCLEAQKEQLDKVTKKYGPLLRIIRGDALQTASGEAQIFYDRGAYRLPGPYALVMSYFINRFEAEIRQNPGAEYVLLCTGYASQEPVRRPLPYLGYACFGPPGAPLHLLPNAPCTPIPPAMTNEQLSFARAYEGAMYLYDNIDPDLRTRIQFVYTGQGEDAVNARYDYQRRIEIKLSKKN